jgi:hypothetical protein
MQLVVVMAVRKAVSADTTTFTAISITGESQGDRHHVSLIICEIFAMEITLNLSKLIVIY